MSFLHSFSLLLYAAIFCIILHLLSNYWRLRRLPGPPLAAFSDAWRMLAVYRRKPQEVQLQLHRRYGDVVRLGPNCVSVSGPDTVSSIYGIGKGFVKSDFYATFQNIVNGQRVASLVAETDEKQHTRTKRTVAHAYSLSTLVSYEPLVDSTTTIFLSRLDELYADTQHVCDFGTWLQYFAFDVIGELTFSKRLGFLETGTDVENIINSIGANFDWFSVIGQWPIWDSWLGKNPLYNLYFRKSVSSPIVKFSQRRLAERLGSEDAGKKGHDTATQDSEQQDQSFHGRPDFLSRFLSLSEENPEPLTDKQTIAHLFANINAGSDTIATTLRAIFYYLLKNPKSLQKLLSELKEAHVEGRLSVPLITWQETKKLPYLEAVIKEGLRIHPPLSLSLERITPASGLQLNDKQNTYLPPGTVVGINPFVLHRDKRIFGEDAEAWNPDRWLGAEELETKQMEHALLTFGAGKRACLGKNIATLELHKIVPALLMRYEIELAEPEKEWTLKNSWLLKQEGLNVKLRYRGQLRRKIESAPQGLS